MRIIIAIILLCLVAYAGYEFVRIESLIGKSKTMIAQTKPYQSSAGVTSILVLGDSTAVGVGASAPDESVPGLLASTLHASVENHAVSGAVTGDMETQLQAAESNHYDVILIEVGANDVVGVDSLGEVNIEMQKLISDAQQYAGKVAIMTSGSVGDAPIFPFFIKPYLNARSAQLSALFAQTAAEQGAVYIDLSGANDIFASDPKKYYAADMFHPSSAGYAAWFQVMKQTLSAQWPDLFYGG